MPRAGQIEPVEGDLRETEVATVRRGAEPSMSTAKSLSVVFSMAVSAANDQAPKVRANHSLEGHGSSVRAHLLSWERFACQGEVLVHLELS